MTPVIEQTVSFDATPAKLYEFFMDSAKHTAATGMPAKVSRKVGGKWSAFSGMILGKNLVLIPNRMIVQSWRSSEWKKADPDSVLVVSFEKSASWRSASAFGPRRRSAVRPPGCNRGLGEVLLGALEGVSCFSEAFVT